MKTEWQLSLATATPEDVNDVADLLGESERHYGLPATPLDEVRKIVVQNIDGEQPVAFVSLARESALPVGFASYSFMWPRVSERLEGSPLLKRA